MTLASLSNLIDVPIVKNSQKVHLFVKSDTIQKKSLRTVYANLALTTSYRPIFS